MDSRLSAGSAKGPNSRIYPAETHPPAGTEKCSAATAAGALELSNSAIYTAEASPERRKPAGTFPNAHRRWRGAEGRQGGRDGHHREGRHGCWGRLGQLGQPAGPAHQQAHTLPRGEQGTAGQTRRTHRLLHFTLPPGRAGDGPVRPRPGTATLHTAQDRQHRENHVPLNPLRCTHLRRGPRALQSRRHQ